MDRLQFLYRRMKCESGHTTDLINDLHYHYADVCCDDDTVVQQILLALDANEPLDRFDQGLKDQIYNVLRRWRQQGNNTPDPWWAC
jgi:hypothetical protein